MQILTPTEKDKDIYSQIDEKLESYCEMSLHQKLFLVQLINEHKPKKLLELGVSAGGSSAVMLNTIKNIPDAKLYSLDYAKKYYKDENKLSGWIVEERFPRLTTNWKLYRGGVISNYIDEIGGEIDFCLLDTRHIKPGEILDFLMIFPYLKKNAVVVFHDIALHLGTPTNFHADCNCTLFSAIKGKKLLPIYDSVTIKVPNIGAVILADDIKDNIFDVFNTLLLHWHYRLKDEDYRVILNSFERHYDEKFVNIFKYAKQINHERLESKEVKK